MLLILPSLNTSLPSNYYIWVSHASEEMGLIKRADRWEYFVDFMLHRDYACLRNWRVGGKVRKGGGGGGERQTRNSGRERDKETGKTS